MPPFKKFVISGISRMNYTTALTHPNPKITNHPMVRSAKLAVSKGIASPDDSIRVANQKMNAFRTRKAKI
jgi:hypothetical protein